MTEETFEVNVTPTGFDNLKPTYEVMVYRYIKGGICGPYSGPVTVVGADAVFAKVTEWGFTLTGEFGPVCANGFATATAEKFGDGIKVSPPDEDYSDTYDVIADLRAPGTDEGMSDEANYEISDALAQRFPSVTFDPEFSCFYAYAKTEAEAEAVLVAVREAVTARRAG